MKLILQCPPHNWITDNRITRVLLSDISGLNTPKQYTKYAGHLVILLTNMLAKSNPITRQKQFIKGL